MAEPVVNERDMQLEASATADTAPSSAGCGEASGTTSTGDLSGMGATGVGRPRSRGTVTVLFIFGKPVALLRGRSDYGWTRKAAGSAAASELPLPRLPHPRANSAVCLRRLLRGRPVSNCLDSADS